MSVPTPILQYNLSDASVKGLLPSGYTPLAYIEFTNANRLINTGITSNNNLKFESKWGNLTHGGYLYGDNNIISSYATVSSGYNWRWGNLTPSSPKPIIDPGINYIEQNKDGVRINGVLQSTYSGTPNFGNASSIYLFGRSDDSNYYLTGKCYYLKIWNNGSLVRDFVPCINSSSVVGLYDLVGRLFYSPSENVLIAGPELAVGKNGGKSLPEEYLLVEYLRMAPGLYINTGYDVAANDVTKTEAWMWYASGNTRDLMGWSVSGANYWGCKADSTWENTSGVSPITQRQKVTYNYTATAAGTYQIGALVGSYSTRTKYIEQVKITIGGSLKRNLYACYRKSDMKPGMYDTVTGAFYTNLGSGEFILGPSITNTYTYEPNANINHALIPSAYLQVEYLLSTGGTLWINTTYPYDSTNTTYRVLCKFLMVSVISAYQGVYGAYTGETYNCFRLLRGNSNTSFLITTNGKAGGNNNSLNVGSIFDLCTIDHSYNSYTISNLTTGNSWTNSSPAHGGGTDTTSTFFVFTQAASSTLTNTKIYYFKLYDNNKLERYMVPCYRKSDNKPGMYDIIHNVFYINNGSGEFTLGPTVYWEGLYTNVSAVYDSVKSWSAGFNRSSAIITGNSFSDTVRSVSFWIKPNTLHSGSQDIVFVDYKSRLGFGRISNSHWLTSTVTTSNTFPATINTGNWYHIVIVNTGSSNTATNRVLYVNSVAITASSSTNSWTSPGDRFDLGKRSSSSDGFDGQIRDFCMYNVALTAAQVKELYGG